MSEPVFLQPGKVPDDFEAVEEHQDDQGVLDQANANYKKLRADRIAKERMAEEDSKDIPRTWCQVDHDVAFSMARERLMPDIGHMVDGPKDHAPLPMLYTGKINGVHGDSESGKSWLALHIAVQEMRASRHVLYLDFEDDGGSIYSRLMSLGASEEMIRSWFIYVRPDSKLTVFEKLSYMEIVNMEGPKSLAVCDGMTESLALESLSARDETEVARWHHLVTKPLAAAGWGPFVIDHTPHGETRQIGTQHKRSAITGVSYEMESLDPFAPGMEGRSRLKVAKDRPGWIRGSAAPGPTPQWYGDLVIKPVGISTVEASIWAWLPPRTEEEQAEHEYAPDMQLQRKIIRYVEKNSGCSLRRIREYVKGRSERIATELERLIDQGCVTTEEGPRKSVLHYYDHDPE